jgi:hypothetical protein
MDVTEYPLALAAKQLSHLFRRAATRGNQRVPVHAPNPDVPWRTADLVKAAGL